MLEYKCKEKGVVEMKKKYGIISSFILLIIALGVLYIYSQSLDEKAILKTQKTNDPVTQSEVHATTSRSELENGLYVIRYDEDYGFQEFLDSGGASSDDDLVNYLMEHVVDISGLDIVKGFFGCSTIQSINEEQDILFGRNFDWENSEALIIESTPKDAYASISTVNLDFIQSGVSIPMDRLPDDILAKISMYAPLDGMNEKGLAISVNMIEDRDVIDQKDKTQNLTTTTAIRTILNQAANVDEAITILQQYNMHSSMGLMVHFAIADASGNQVVVEYINQEMKVINTPVVTNYYLSQGDKYGIGSEQSHDRYEILMDLLNRNETLSMNQMKDALNRVSKDNFDEFESTEWSIVYNLNQKEIHYYHRENYDQRYVFHLDDK